MQPAVVNALGCPQQNWRSSGQMSRELSYQRYITVIIIFILLFSFGGCKTGGGKGFNLITPVIMIGGLKYLEYKSTLPVRITIDSGGEIIVTLAMAIKVGRDGEFMAPTPLAGRFDPTSLQQLLVPAGGTQFTFWWHAIADLGAGAVHDPVYVRATITTSDGRVSSITFGPMAINLTDALGGALPPYVPDSELPSSWCGALYEVQLPVLGGCPPFEWSLEPIGTRLPYVLELSHDGIVRGEFPEDYGPITIEFAARVFDSNPVYPRESAGNFMIFVGCEPITTCGPPPEILFTSLPAANEGESYFFQSNVSGGYEPLTWDITSGALPDGLIFSPDGLISGTPDTGSEGAYPLTILVTDSCPDGARTDAVDVILNVEAEAPGCDPGPTILTQTLPGGKEGEAFDATLQAEGGHGNLSWSLDSGNLPDGIHVTPNGHVTGTPGAGSGGSAGESYTFIVEVCDSCPLAVQCDTQQLVLLIAPLDAPCDPGPEIVSESPLDPGTEGVAYMYQMLASGGQGAKTWTINNPLDLPEGLDFNNQGKLSGTPAAGSSGDYNLDITVSDSCPEVQTDQGIFELTINSVPCADPPVITTPTIDEGFENTLYDFQFEATGGEGTLSWSHSGGDPLPNGLMFDTDGRLHGTPAIGTANTYEIEIEVEDECPSAPQTDSNLFNLIINPLGCAEPPTIMTTELAPGVEGIEYEQILTAQDGEGNLIWEILVDNDSLPAGLTLTGNVITGIPDSGTEGPYALHIEVCDSCPDEQCDDELFNLTIYPPCATGPTITTETPLPGAIIGESYSVFLEADDGEGALTWQVVVGGQDLPAGLELIGNEITGTAEAGTEGSYFVQFEVCDSCGIPQCDNTTLQLPVGTDPCDPGPVITTIDVPEAIVGIPYNFQFEATGGDGLMLWRLEDPLSLPAQFNLGPTGALSGTPDDTSVGSYDIVVIITDSCWAGAQSDQKPFTFVVDWDGCAPPPEIINAPMLEVPAGAVVDLRFFAQFGEGALTWSLENISPPLPGTVALDPSGRLIGITDITEFGTYTFDVRACDECTDPAIQCDLLEDFSLSLLEASGCANPAPTIDDVTIPEPVPDGTGYSYTMSSTGGDEPIIWYGFGFPFGIDIDSVTGEIYGATTETGTFNVYIGIFDACIPIPQADSAMYAWDLS